MPQMSPMSWMILYLVFTTTLMIFNSMMYFNSEYKMNKLEKSIKIKENTWKW